MDCIEHLVSRAGAWAGTTTLYAEGDPALGRESHTVAAITPVLHGRFVRFDYTWSDKGKPHAGSMLIGHDAKTGIATTHWIDTWHMGRAVLACMGTGTGATISVRGSYPAPPDPDWGWRIDLDSSDPQRIRLQMTNITPAGEEALAVDASYSRT